MLSTANHPILGAQSLIVDSATGLQWLKVTLSGTRSFNNMTGADGSSEFAAGRPFAGFRYATMAEVEALWASAGVPKSVLFYGLDSSGHNIGTFSTNTAAIFNAARAFQQLMGFELSTANLPHVNSGGWNTRGIAVGKDGALGHPSLDTCTPGTGFCGGSSLPITRAHMGGTHPTAWQPLIGYHHWLVVSGRAKYGSDVRKIPLPPRPRPR